MDFVAPKVDKRRGPRSPEQLVKLKAASLASWAQDDGRRRAIAKKIGSVNGRANKGKTGRRHSPETRKKQSVAKLGYRPVRAANRHAFLRRQANGGQFSPATIAKWDLALGNNPELAAAMLKGAVNGKSE
jgi:hypothetical protein